MNWETISTGSYNKKCPRTLEDEAEYQFHKGIAKEMIGSIEEYVQTLYIDPLEPYRFINNRFSYDLATGIKHYVLWMNPGYNIPKKYIPLIILQKFPEHQITYIMNEPHNRSIHTVPHYHVFAQEIDVIS